MIHSILRFINTYKYILAVIVACVAFSFIGGAFVVAGSVTERCVWAVMWIALVGALCLNTSGWR